MNKPKYHVLICSSSRLVGEPRGSCYRRSSPDLVQYVEESVAEHGLEGVLVTNTGCLKQCEGGPLMVVYPGGHWYGKVDEEVIDAVLGALAEGEVCRQSLIA